MFVTMREPQCYTTAPVVIAKACETMLSSCDIPIINLEHVGTEIHPPRHLIHRIAPHLIKALREKGVALLVNHGVPDHKMKGVYHKLEDFCDLPMETREKYASVSPSLHGYSSTGINRFAKENGVQEMRESFSMTGQGGAMPDEEVPGFSEAMDELRKDLKLLAITLLNTLSVGLDKSPDFLGSKHSNILKPGNGSTIRSIYYPPVPLMTPGQVRCEAHSDHSTFTLIAQDCDGGLEVQTAHGSRWLRLGHLNGAMLIYTGDILEHWTNGELVAIPHRMVVPQLNLLRRRAIVFHVQPDDLAEIEPFHVPPVPEAQDDLASFVLRQKKKRNSILNAYHHLTHRIRAALYAARTH